MTNRVMPNPKKLKVGGRVRFISLPDKWLQPDWHVPQSSVVFMKTMIQRTWPSRVFAIDQRGYPWIWARIKKNGKYHYHEWCIREKTGWRQVKFRQDK